MNRAAGIMAILFGFALIGAVGFNTKQNDEPIPIYIPLPTDSAPQRIWKAPWPCWLQSVDCIVDGDDTGESALILVRICDSAGQNCEAADVPISCDNNGATDDGTFEEPRVDQGDWLAVDPGAITSAGTIDLLTGTIVCRK